MTSGRLFVIGTPIGNLSDISIRALDILQKVDLIAAEDTRHSLKMLTHFGIKTPVCSYHDHSGDAVRKKIIRRLREGKNVALISDAGTPCISDPGYRLVVEVQEQNICVTPIPGPSALVTALSVSGLPSDRFLFTGFLPTKGAAREKAIEEMCTCPYTWIFYESSHRILSTIKLLERMFGGDRKVVVAKELTKCFETILLGSLNKIYTDMEANHLLCKGEFVVLVDRYEAHQDTIFLEAKKVIDVLISELSFSQTISMTAKITGIQRGKLYEYGLHLYK